MTYQSITEMAGSQSLQARIAACAAEEGLTTPPTTWAYENIWQIVASGNWDAAWDSARAGASVNDNPDTGARNDVITDGMILSVVQPMMPEVQTMVQPMMPEPMMPEPPVSPEPSE